MQRSIHNVRGDVVVSVSLSPFLFSFRCFGLFSRVSHVVWYVFKLKHIISTIQGFHFSACNFSLSPLFVIVVYICAFISKCAMNVYSSKQNWPVSENKKWKKNHIELKLELFSCNKSTSRKSVDIVQNKIRTINLLRSLPLSLSLTFPTLYHLPSFYRSIFLHCMK